LTSYGLAAGVFGVRNIIELFMLDLYASFHLDWPG